MGRIAPSSPGAWGAVAAVLAAATWTFAACNDGSSSDAPLADPPPASSGDGTSSSGCVSTWDAAASGSGPAATVATEPNLKVAFIGDTASGADFKSVLALIRQENAHAVLIQGDLTYAGAGADDWFSAIDSEIDKALPGSPAPVTIPFFVSRGNHDIGWEKLGAGLRDRMKTWGVAPEADDPTNVNYSVVFKGLKVVMVGPDETCPTRDEYVNQRLQGDAHVWKICSWHKNQRATNVGPKDDEMGWEIYESCRRYGAIVAQGHSHTYSRSKTITDDTKQTVDGACSDPFALCVGPGRHFFFDSSLGGVDTRKLDTTVAGAPYWASTYTGNFGALFIEFNVDGDPKKARGYFKTAGGVLVDPPPASGKTSFTIVAP